jgi:hypothetical protein
MEMPTLQQQKHGNIKNSSSSNSHDSSSGFEAARGCQFVFNFF